MAGEEEQQEEGDFSFPTTTSSPPRFIGSPRLWRSSSYSLYLNQTKLTKQEHEEECILAKEYRKAISMLSYTKHKDCDGNHENMDVIWEDLNYEDEIDGVKRRTGSVSGDFGYENYMPAQGRKEKRYRGEVAVAGGGGKRPSMVVLINMLKKFLLMSHVTRNVK